MKCEGRPLEVVTKLWMGTLSSNAWIRSFRHFIVLEGNGTEEIGKEKYQV